ncbi:porin [Enterovibrio nigricans]|uniref:Outer membrane protein (Porin) n=1 Tax=Enterovibrio nigricans DSM 22720 TaxID=1121868 RepID=A0A1T4U6F4_9GAMM|nr:porin [Enterovibrio nigricans]PKF51713.1 porin [Enterovibrio nigricans]SKA48335.1 Outer membrane protein (porin) [Enterovibrio nigricans DSM 22720]
MDKTFRRSLLGAAVAMAAVSGSANAAIELAGEAVQIYGQAAASYQFWDPAGTGKEQSAGVEVESRIGFRGVVEFDNFAPNFVWQIESGNANNRDSGTDPWNKYHGILGGRDTYVGFQFEDVGTVTFGRRTIAVYDYVDWPHTNPGLGNVFDWNNAIGADYETRADNVLRFDSANFGGFNFQATLSGMGADTEQAVVSVAGSYTGSNFSVHGGHYAQGGWTETTEDSYKFDTETGEKELVEGETAKKGDVSYSLIGGSVWFGKATFTAGYKMMDNDRDNTSQNALSVTAAYWLNDQWLAKVGYAQSMDSNASDKDDTSTAMSARLLYSLPSMVIYFDARNYEMLNDKDHADSGTRFMLGTEYYF